MKDLTGEQLKWEAVKAGKERLARGDAGQAVTMLQERLSAVGYDVPITGTFCVQTEFSVMDLQKNHQQERTGIVDLSAANLLDRMWEHSWEQVAAGYANHGLGSQCAAVSTLQKKLSEIGVHLEVSGVFGPTTKRVLSAFQIQHGLPGTGILDQATSHKVDAVHAAAGTLPKRGAPNPSEMVALGSALVMPPVAEALQRMRRAARGDGVLIQILEGYRDETRQHAAAREAGFVRTSSCTGSPGKNAHGTGFAVDLDDGRSYRWLRRNAAVFGFAMPHAGEPWHWVFQKR